MVNASSIGSGSGSGYGKIVAQEGNKLEIEFEHAGLKKALASFVSAEWRLGRLITRLVALFNCR